MKRYFAILNLMLATVAIYFGVDFFYTLVTADMSIAPLTITPDKQIAPLENKIRPKLSHYETIPKQNIFELGKNAPPSETANKTESLKKTSLNIKLWGTILGTGYENFAVIESGGKQDLYHIGDKVQNAGIKAIFWKKVVLRINGIDEILEMEKHSSSGRKPSSRKTRNIASTRNINVKRSKIEKASQDIGELMMQVHIQPYFEKGKPGGLRVSRIKPRSIFRELGLINGDVVTGINGVPIKTVDNALKLYDSLKSSNNVKLDIKRRGNAQAIIYSIQ